MNQQYAPAGGIAGACVSTKSILAQILDEIDGQIAIAHDRAGSVTAGLNRVSLESKLVEARGPEAPTPVPSTFEGRLRETLRRLSNLSARLESASVHINSLI